MAAEAPEMSHGQALVGLNRSFLGLVCASPADQPAFGLEPAVLARLRALPATARDALAAAPVLLAGCRSLPRTDGGVAEDRPFGPVPRATSNRPCQLFATALLTWLWQLARSDPLAAALHTGPSSAIPAWLRQAAFRDIEQAAAAPGWLEARFADNARLWPDLVRAAASGDPDLLTVTRLSFVQLALVAPRAGPRPEGRRAVPGEPSP